MVLCAADNAALACSTARLQQHCLGRSAESSEALAVQTGCSGFCVARLYTWLYVRLTSNALMAMPTGFTAVISAKSRHLQRLASALAALCAAHVWLAVQVAGVLDKEQQPLYLLLTLSYCYGCYQSDQPTQQPKCKGFDTLWNSTQLPVAQPLRLYPMATCTLYATCLAVQAWQNLCCTFLRRWRQS